MKIVICDDSEKDRNTILNFINHYLESEGYDTHNDIVMYNKAEALLENNNYDFDLIFLDIFMDTINGIDCAKKIREVGFKGSIVFSTSSEEFALDAFKVRASDYLVKPYEYKQFSETMDIVMEKLAAQLKQIEVNSNYEKRTVYLRDIYYIETIGRNTVIHTKDESFKTIKTLQNFTDILCGEKNFYRCHRCCIVNFNHIIKCNEDHFEFENGDKIYFKTRNKAETKNAYYNYHFSTLNNS